MTNEELVKRLTDAVGGTENIESLTHCMTRLRLQLQEDEKIRTEEIRRLEGVLGVVHDRPKHLEVVVGPERSRPCAQLLGETLRPAQKAPGQLSTENDWQTNKAAVSARQKTGRIQSMLKTFGDIFVPLLPGAIAAGLCSGIATLLAQLYPSYGDSTFWNLVYNFLSLISSTFMTYLAAWAGYRAAERFGATPILGGMLGILTTLGGIDNISRIVGLYSEEQPLEAILRAGRGGVLAAVIGVWFLAQVEKAVRKRMPATLDIMFTPLITLVVCAVPYVLIIMPLTGLVSTGLCWGVEQVCMSSHPLVRIVAGFVSAAIFLPMVAMGMHHGLVALYTVQLETLGFVTLYPALAMAGAGQVGAALAIARKARRLHNQRLSSVIHGALTAGILGVGEPLIYGVTLPMGKPFFTAGFGAAFGGAFVMAMQVASTTWGPSGLLAFPVMTAGPNSAVLSMVYYGIGLLISYVMGFLITNALVTDEEVTRA